MESFTVNILICWKHQEVKVTICEQDEDVTMFLKSLVSDSMLYETHTFLKCLEDKI